MQKPSLKSIKKILNRSAFDPRKPGPMSIIAENQNPLYLLSRSMEFINEAKIKDDDSLLKAIFLLALAQNLRELECNNNLL